MKTSCNDKTLICLEKTGKDCINYEESYKLNFDHYQKVLEARREKGAITTKFALEIKNPQVGDYVSANGIGNTVSMTGAVYSKPVFGLVMKDEKGRLYIQSYKLMHTCSKRIDHFYCPEKEFLTCSDGTKSKSVINVKVLFRNNCNETVSLFV